MEKLDFKLRHRLGKFDLLQSISWEHSFAAFIGAITGVILLAGYSLYSPVFAYYAIMVWLAALILWSPGIGFCLMLFVVPIQNLFALDSTHFGRIRTISLAFLFVSVLTHKEYIKESFKLPVIWLIAGFVSLAVLHSLQNNIDPKDIILTALYLSSLGLVYLISLHLSTTSVGVKLIGIAIASSAIFCAVITFLFLFVPIPNVIAYHGELDNLRLAGVQDNPNAMAKFLAVALMIMIANASLNPKPPIWLMIIVTACGVLLAATGTKSAILGITIALLGATLIGNRKHIFLKHLAMTLSLATFAYFAWVFAIAPIANYHAAMQWVARKEYNLNYYIKNNPRNLMGVETSNIKPTNSSIVPYKLEKLLHNKIQDVRNTARLDQQYKMDFKNGKITYTSRQASLLTIGQRDRTLKGGLEIIKRHWLWGIGNAERWQVNMQELIGYPFDSPHNSILEVWGSYGIAGLVMYIIMIYFFIRNFIHLRNGNLVSWQAVANEWTFMAGATFLGIELIDTLTLFAQTIHSITLWSILGAQQGIVKSMPIRLIHRPTASSV